ncbi:MAG TPA: amino acid permease [Terriglobales bacterium]|nr:amino acid permease [Terriglobales bacterium]
MANTTTTNSRSEQPSSQLLARKSIDKLIAESEEPEHRLKKSLGPWSLTALGIGAIIGSGIFVLTGTAAAGEYFQAPNLIHAQVLDLIVNFFRSGNAQGVLMHGRPPAGPAIAISFILVAIACSFAGLCYAELASMIPIAGSAYTYSYATLGEIFAWIIGWDLILEYAVSNVAVAVGFSGYLKAQLASFGLVIPDKWSTPVHAGGQWTGAYFNLPAFLVVFILTVLLIRGVRESAETNNIMVVIKLGAIITFLVIGGMLVNKNNWHPFAPSGFSGIVTGGAIIFFTYIGFDSVSTAAEEAKEPRRDIPFGIIASLIVCTILYVGVALVLLGMMPFPLFRSGTQVVQVQLAQPSAAFEQQVHALPQVAAVAPGSNNVYRVVVDGDREQAGAVAQSIAQLAGQNGTTVSSSSVSNAAEAPVAYALATLGANKVFQAIIIIGALTGMLSSLLVFQYGQTRIWFAMSRDGLLPGIFSAVHAKFKTPHWSTWIAGFAVGIPAGLVDIGDAADLSNIGTLFAFVLVSLGVIMLRRTQPERPRGFRVPLVPLFPLISVVLCGGLMTGLTVITWIRFFVWLGIGLLIYFLYSRRHSEFASRT